MEGAAKGNDNVIGYPAGIIFRQSHGLSGSRCELARKSEARPFVKIFCVEWPISLGLLVDSARC